MLRERGEEVESPRERPLPRSETLLKDDIMFVIGVFRIKIIHVLILGSANRVINGLVHFRQYMTIQEIYSNLDLLIQISESDTGKSDLRQFLPSLFNVFKHLLVEYDSSQINAAVVTILTNVTKKTLESVSSKPNEISPSTPLLVADVCTEVSLIFILHSFHYF